MKEKESNTGRDRFSLSCVLMQLERFRPNIVSNLYSQNIDGRSCDDLYRELNRWPKIEPKKSFSHSKDKNRKLNRKCLTWRWNHQNKQRFMTYLSCIHTSPVLMRDNCGIKMCKWAAEQLISSQAANALMCESLWGHHSAECSSCGIALCANMRRKSNDSTLNSWMNLLSWRV